MYPDPRAPLARQRPSSEQTQAFRRGRLAYGLHQRLECLQDDFVDIAEIRTILKFQVQRMEIDERFAYQECSDRCRTGTGARAEERWRGRAITNAGQDIEDARRELGRNTQMCRFGPCRGFQRGIDIISLRASKAEDLTLTTRRTRSGLTKTQTELEGFKVRDADIQERSQQEPQAPEGQKARSSA
ncbi:hypothetical protein C8R44DRAFT_855697 [Mycena epipterygia]|nr:hypothetical protein C8R44DRAFT_855697 [Mycena epipterygia]